MGVLLYGAWLYGIALALHLAVWKVHVPRKQMRALLVLFLAVLVCGSAVFARCAESVSILGLGRPVSAADYVQVGLFFVALSLAYIVTYSAVAADSPTLIMILRIAEAGGAGMDRASLERAIDDNVLIAPRLKDLLTAQLVELDGETYRLTLKGVRWARLFAFYRNLIRAGKGG
jgi:hypothetical protein